MLLFDPFKRFIALLCNHFDSGWKLLTTAAHNQKLLIKTKASAIQGIAAICRNI